MAKPKKHNDPKELAQAMRRMQQGPIPSDVLGSYTGTDEEGGAPVQDADDL